uniref:Uncharacterized protein n=1 Tax=Anguilla anguilla TaxID=7936 RepID=A0A0E9RCR3_ANGAN
MEALSNLASVPVGGNVRLNILTSSPGSAVPDRSRLICFPSFSAQPHTPTSLRYVWV